MQSTNYTVSCLNSIVLEFRMANIDSNSLDINRRFSTRNVSDAQV